MGRRAKAPAGCFPLSIAKVMTLFKYPDSFTHNKYKVDWNSLSSYNGYSTAEGRKSAAALLYSISLGCDSWYFYAGTFTFPGKATDFMEFCGFNNVGKESYKYKKVKEMIDNKCPVIIYAMPGVNVFKSHCWNIDGYMEKERTVTTTTKRGNTVINTNTSTEKLKMVHCDFGWSGKNNGYYVDGIFKANGSPTEFDNYSGNDTSVKYNSYIHIITYDKPNGR